MKFKKKWTRTILVILLPVVSYFLLGPLEIYFGNQKDFAFKYSDFFWLFLLLSVSVLMLGSLIIALLPEKVNRILSALILGIGVASYVQNMFMNIKLSEVNGAPMDWTSLGNFPTINGIIYCGIVVVIVVLSLMLEKYWNAISMGSAAFLSAVQLVAVISLLVTAPAKTSDTTDLQESGEKQFKVASESNIIVFILDTFGNTQIEQIQEIYPDALDGLKDFTYYNNADCHYYVTFPSMTHMLTGLEFDFDMSAPKWLQKAWTSPKANTFFETIRDVGYERNLYSLETGYVYGDMSNLEGKFDNILPMKQIVHKWQLLKKMGKLSIYRYVPYFVKPYFEVVTKDFSTVTDIEEGRSVVDDNGEFYQVLVNEGLSVDEKMEKAFIIQHLFGVHKPYTINADAQIVEESTMTETGMGLITIVNEYLQQLKELNVYDKSTIIITADHGAWYGGDTQPIYFIKKRNETHDGILMNSAPISADDFQATILSILEKDYSEYGTSIYDWNEEDERERTVYMPMIDEEYPAVEGSVFNVYYKYSYFGDKKELNQKVANGPEEVLPAASWELWDAWK